MKPYLLMFMAAVLVVGGCKQKPPPEEPARTPIRTDFSPEDFGIGRKHTKDPACNREIDLLLDQARLCYGYGSRPATECEALQSSNSHKIGRLKNSSRCSHS